MSATNNFEDFLRPDVSWYTHPDFSDAFARLTGETIMSWSIWGVTDQPARVARERIEADNNLPQSVKDYVLAGIDGIVATTGDEMVPVTASGHGHICMGPGSFAVTTASILVKQGSLDEKPVEPPSDMEPA